MALSEGLSLREDFEEAVAEVGQTVRFTREGYEDARDVWRPKRSWSSRVILQGINTAQPYMTHEVGLHNLLANDAHYLYIPVSAGEPFETDTLFFNGFTWTLSNLNTLVVDDTIVYYYALITRTK